MTDDAATPSIIAAILGPPGSGKGTQAGPLCRTFGLVHISTGELLRAEVESGSALGREVEPIMRRGALVPDDLVIRVIEQRLHRPDARRGVLLDGFPRTLAQARALDAMLERRGRAVDLVVSLEVPYELLEARILRRAREEGRPDDTPEAIVRRMEVYQAETIPVLDYYRRLGSPTRVLTIDGVGTVDEVRQRVQQAVAEVLGGGPAPVMVSR